MDCYWLYYIKKENAESLYTSSAITKGEILPLNSNTGIIPQTAGNINPSSGAKAVDNAINSQVKAQKAEVSKQKLKSTVEPNGARANLEQKYKDRYKGYDEHSAKNLKYAYYLQGKESQQKFIENFKKDVKYAIGGRVLDENAPNNTVNMFLSKLNDKEVSSVELNLLKNTLDNFTAIMDNGGKVVDIENILKVLKNKSFRSQEAKGFIELLETLKPIIGQDKVLFSSMAKFKNGQQLSQGISTDPTARAHTMVANQTIKTTLRLLPIIGRKPALIHH